MTQTNAAARQSKQAPQNVVYPGGDFLVSLSQKIGQRLFGGTPLQSRDRITEYITVPSGNVAVHFTQRTPAIGIPVIVPGTHDIEATIAAIAQQLTDATKQVDGVNAQQLFRIALEYTAQLAALPPTQIEPWEQYLPIAIQLRQAFSEVNTTARYAMDSAFDKKDAQRAVKAGINGKKALGTIKVLLQQSPHLATFRAEIDLPPMFMDAPSWIHLMSMQQSTRKATIAQILKMIAQSGNPLVTEIRVQQAADRVHGLQRLSHGNQNGITPRAFITAATQARFAQQVKPNGGKTAMFTGVDLTALGNVFSGMYGTADVEACLRDDGTMQVNANVQEGGQPQQVFVPTFWKSTPSQYPMA